MVVAVSVSVAVAVAVALPWPRPVAVAVAVATGGARYKNIVLMCISFIRKIPLVLVIGVVLILGLKPPS